MTRSICIQPKHRKIRTYVDISHSRTIKLKDYRLMFCGGNFVNGNRPIGIISPRTIVHTYVEYSNTVKFRHSISGFMSKTERLIDPLGQRTTYKDTVESEY